MFSKKNNLSFLLITTLISNMNIMPLSDSSYAECYKGKDGEYRYLEFYFIEQPKNMLNDHLKKARAMILAGCTSAIFANSQVPFFNTSISTNTITAGIFGLTAFDLYSSCKESEIKVDILTKFIANWEFHKEYIPATLVPAFDELAAAFNASKAKTFLSEDVNAIFSIIHHLVEHEFSKRYEKEKKKDTDMVGLFKTVTDISKNLSK